MLWEGDGLVNGWVRVLTGEPVILSPRGMIFVAASAGATKTVNAPKSAKAMVEVRMNILAFESERN